MSSLRTGGFDVDGNADSIDIPVFTRGYLLLMLIPHENQLIHVEKIIGAVCQCFQVLSATGVLQNSHKTSTGVVLDSVVRICCALNKVVMCFV